MKRRTLYRREDPDVGRAREGRRCETVTRHRASNPLPGYSRFNLQTRRIFIPASSETENRSWSGSVVTRWGTQFFRSMHILTTVNDRLGGSFPFVPSIVPTVFDVTSVIPSSTIACHDSSNCFLEPLQSQNLVNRWHFVPINSWFAT